MNVVISPAHFHLIPREPILSEWLQFPITSDIEVIPIQKVNEACKRAVKGNAKYRFTIDMAS